MSFSGRDPRTGRSIEVKVENGRITAIEQAPAESSEWISAGLVDLQVNGYGGLDLNANDLSPETVIELAHRLLAVGVTTFLPTLITASKGKTLDALRAIARARQLSSSAAYMIPGVHMEGPHLSSEDGARGAHPLEHIRPPSLDEFSAWQIASGGLVTLVTLSPHFAEAPGYIAALKAQGVRVSIGHTHCTPEQIHAAADAGASLSTHLGNGVGNSLPRHPNLIWAQLADDRLNATFIADGHHLPADTLIAMLRAKSLDRAVIVSDTVALAGMSPGRYFTPIGGEVELTPAGKLRLAGTDFLAGSALPLKDGLAYLTKAVGLSLADSLKLGTENPGRFVSNRGRLEVGSAADLIRFSVDKSGGWTIKNTIVLGKDSTAE